MAQPVKVGGLRTASETPPVAVVPEAPFVLPDKKQGVYQFRSRAAALWYSLRRRRIERGPDGEKEEVAPRCGCKNADHDLPLDLVHFENNYFETPCPKLAALIESKAKQDGLWGVGNHIWSIEDERKAQDEALENELRARLAARPDIAERVLKPGVSDDFQLPPTVG